MIKFITTADTLPLRNLVLRESKLKDEECVFDHDNDEDTFHLGYYDQDQLVCVASFHHQSQKDFPGNAFQLRGMATKEEFRGKGFGNMLLNFAIVYLRGRKVNYIWCNARKIAFKFYESIGFEFVSPEFMIEEIGIHRTMYLKIQ
jgi:ribosomal protein S18 acetylase RimI-like enzyme